MLDRAPERFVAPRARLLPPHERRKDGHVTVFWKTRPLSEEANYDFRPEGLSIEEIAKSVGMPRRFWDDGVATIDDDEIPRALWGKVRPKSGRLVTLQIRLGKSVVKKVVKFVEGVISSITSLFVSPPPPPPIAALNMLSPAPSLTTVVGGASSANESVQARPQQGTASLSGNVLSPGDIIPRVIGTHRVFPPFLCEPLQEVVGPDEYAEVVMGLAGPHDLSVLKIGDVLGADIAELSYEFHSGFVGTGQQTLINRQAKTQHVGIEVSQHRLQDGDNNALEDQIDPINSLPRWHRMVTRDSPDEVWIPIVFQQGAWDTENPTRKHFVPIRVRFRMRGETEWVNAPEFFMRSDSASGFTKTIKLMFRNPPGPVVTPPTARDLTDAWKVVPTQGVSPVGIGGWTANAHFSAGSGNNRLHSSTIGTTNVRNTFLYRDRVEFYLGGFDKGIYEIEVIQGMLVNPEDFNAGNYQLDGAVHDFFGYITPAGTALTAQSIDNRYYKMNIPRISSVWNNPPIISSNVATVALRVRNRALSEISVLASGWVRDIDGNDEWEEWSTTANPAVHYRDVLTGRINADPLPLDLLDEEEILDWRELCETEGYEAHAVVSGESVFQIGSMLAAAGHARMRQSERWGVMIDRDRSEESPLQMFSSRSMTNFGWDRGFANKPDGLRVRFSDAVNDYREGEIIVLDPRQDSGGKRLESVRYDGIVNEDVARERALFDMAQSWLRQVRYSGEVGWSSLRARRGDLVAVQHDTLKHFAGYSRISEVRRDPENQDDVIGLLLDGSIYNDTIGFFLDSSFFEDFGSESPPHFFEAPRLGLAINLLDGDGVIVVEGEGAHGDIHDVSLAEPYTDADGKIAPGNQITAGPLGSEYRRLIIMSIKPGQDLTAALTFVDEAPELWN